MIIEPWGTPVPAVYSNAGLYRHHCVRSHLQTGLRGWSLQRSIRLYYMPMYVKSPVHSRKNKKSFSHYLCHVTAAGESANGIRPVDSDSHCTLRLTAFFSMMQVCQRLNTYDSTANENSTRIIYACFRQKRHKLLCILDLLDTAVVTHANYRVDFNWRDFHQNYAVCPASDENF